MKILDRAKERIRKYLRVKDIGDGRGNTFFRRYHLIRTRVGGVYLHEFVRGDIDRCLHDHPWSFLAVVLKGGYWEEMFDPAEFDQVVVKHWRRPGAILWRPARTAHRIDIDPDVRTRSKTWSLVIVGRPFREWGFWTVHGWRKHKAGDPNPICEL